MNDLKIDIQSIESKITINNVIDLLKKHIIFRRFFSQEISNEIEFISIHFYEIADMLKKDIETLGFDVIERIIKNDKLQISCEDQLITFINEIYMKNPLYSDLYTYVLFANVSPEKMKEFIDIIYFDHINISIWKSISNRLIKKIIKSKQKEDEDKNSRYKGIVLNREDGQEFNGIIKFIKDNSNDKIKFSASSVEAGCLPDYAIYSDKSRYFHSQNIENSWICIDFKEKKIIPTLYEIKSYPFDTNDQHPRIWVIEASNDKNSWAVVDQVNDGSYLNGRSISHSFQIKNVTSQKFRYLRMRLTGTNFYGQYSLAINAIEFYGTLFK